MSASPRGSKCLSKGLGIIPRQASWKDSVSLDESSKGILNSASHSSPGSCQSSKDGTVFSEHRCSECISAKSIWMKGWREEERNPNLLKIFHVPRAVLSLPLCWGASYAVRQATAGSWWATGTSLHLFSVQSPMPGSGGTGEKEEDTVPALNLLIGKKGISIPTSRGSLYVKGDKICKALSLA